MHILVQLWQCAISIYLSIYLSARLFFYSLVPAGSEQLAHRAAARVRDRGALTFHFDSYVEKAFVG